MTLDHIGIAVPALDTHNELFARLLGREHYKIEEVADQGAATSFFTAGEAGRAKLEMVASTRAGSPIEKFIDKRGPGLHHLAFACTDMEAELDRLRQAGFQVLDGYPRPGADEMLVAFLHPKTTGGILVEICQPLADKE